MKATVRLSNIEVDLQGADLQARAIVLRGTLEAVEGRAGGSLCVVLTPSEDVLPSLWSESTDLSGQRVITVAAPSNERFNEVFGSLKKNNQQEFALAFTPAETGIADDLNLTPSDSKAKC